jgi:hypothetical protein
MSTGTKRPTVLEIPEDGLTDFELDRELLNSTAFRSPYCKRLIDPIEVAKHKVHDLDSAQSINRA